jgi:hypothetical protein
MNYASYIATTYFDIGILLTIAIVCQLTNISVNNSG